jgi:hypothetical protein
MNVATPRIGIAALAVLAVAAVTFGVALMSNVRHPLPKSHAEVSIAQLADEKDMKIVPAPAAASPTDTVTVQATR